MTAEDAFKLGKPSLRMLTYLIAGAMVEGGCREDRRHRTTATCMATSPVVTPFSPWARIYLDQRKLGRDRLDWTLGHQHAAALHPCGEERWSSTFGRSLATTLELPALREEIAAWRPAEVPKIARKGSKPPVEGQGRPTCGRKARRCCAALHRHTIVGGDAGQRPAGRGGLIVSRRSSADVLRRRVVRRAS